MSNFLLTGFADEAAPDLSGQIEALKKNRMSYVELRMVDGISIADFDAVKARATKAALADAGIGVSCLGSPLGKISLDDPLAPHLEKTRQLCETAHLLGTDKIRIFSFYLPQNHTPEQCRGEVIDRLGRMLDIAESAECVLLHENERDIYGDTWERCLDLHSVFQNRLGGILDPANYLLVGSNPLAAMQGLFKWIEYLHIKDVRLSDSRVVPAGKGDGQLAEIVALFSEKPGVRFLSVEPHLTHFSGREKLEKDSSNTPHPGSAADDYIYQDSMSAFSAAVSYCRELLN